MSLREAVAVVDRGSEARRSYGRQYWRAPASNRKDATEAEEVARMSRWLLLPFMMLPLLAPTASAAARDRDHDGLPDRWERRYHLSTAKKSGRRDPDRDGLRNRREYRLRTNPRRKDTDRDGLRDRAEVRRYKTNPRKKDTDGDGFSDGAEVRAGTNPRDPNSHPAGSPSNPGPGPAGPGPADPAPGGSACPLPAHPDAGCTGVPAGTTLTPSGGMTISTAGTVIDGREITGQVVVNAPNVTIRNSRIHSNTMWVVDNNSTGLVIEDSEIVNRPVAGQNNCHNGIGNANFTVRRTEITGCENSMNIDDPGNVTVVDSWIHDLDTEGPSYVWGSTPHTDGVQVGEGATNLVFRHNTIDPTPGNGGVTSGIIMYTDPGAQNANVWIEDNYIDGRGASYAIYAPRSQTHDVYINRNRLTRGYDYTACVKLGITVTSFEDNRDALTGAAVGPDNGSGGSCSN
jgi:thrombospondin type 3 repeat protein